ncbi:hypothetical protein [Photobacterium halotolerans]|nr:hypothetical protein [Photobacterium halotolerans]
MAVFRKIFKWLSIACIAVVLVSGGYLAKQRYENSKWHFKGGELLINPVLSFDNFLRQNHSRIVMESDGRYVHLSFIGLYGFDPGHGIYLGQLDLDLFNEEDTAPVDLGKPRTETIKVNGQWVKFNGFTKSRYLKPSTSEGQAYLLSELRQGKVEFESKRGHTLVFDGSGVDKAFQRLNRRMQAMENPL